MTNASVSSGRVRPGGEGRIISGASFADGVAQEDCTSYLESVTESDSLSEPEHVVGDLTPSASILDGLRSESSPNAFQDGGASSLEGGRPAGKLGANVGGIAAKGDCCSIGNMGGSNGAGDSGGIDADHAGEGGGMAQQGGYAKYGDIGNAGTSGSAVGEGDAARSEPCGNAISKESCCRRAGVDVFDVASFSTDWADSCVTLACSVSAPGGAGIAGCSASGARFEDVTSRADPSQFASASTRSIDIVLREAWPLGLQQPDGATMRARRSKSRGYDASISCAVAAIV